MRIMHANEYYAFVNSYMALRENFLVVFCCDTKSHFNYSSTTLLMSAR
jgi:hypothetical protein